MHKRAFDSQDNEIANHAQTIDQTQHIQIVRKKIADERGVPPFVIFGDKALQEMSYYFPESLEEFSKISGVRSGGLKWAICFSSAALIYILNPSIKDLSLSFSTVGFLIKY